MILKLAQLQKYGIKKMLSLTIFQYCSRIFPVATPEFGAYLKIKFSAWSEKLKKDPNAKPENDGITFDEFMDRINDPKIDKLEYARPMPSKFVNQAMQEINMVMIIL